MDGFADGQTAAEGQKASVQAGDFDERGEDSRKARGTRFENGFDCLTRVQVPLSRYSGAATRYMRRGAD